MSLRSLSCLRCGILWRRMCDAASMLQTVSLALLVRASDGDGSRPGATSLFAILSPWFTSGHCLASPSPTSSSTPSSTTPTPTTCSTDILRSELMGVVVFGYTLVCIHCHGRLAVPPQEAALFALRSILVRNGHCCIHTAYRKVPPAYVLPVPPTRTKLGIYRNTGLAVNTNDELEVWLLGLILNVFDHGYMTETRLLATITYSVLNRRDYGISKEGVSDG